MNNIVRLLKPSTGFSAKIAAGIFGWVFSAGFAVYSAVTGNVLPSSVELFMLLSCGLLGLDALENIVTAVFGKKIESDNEEY